jgi:hypothetical protein
LNIHFLHFFVVGHIADLGGRLDTLELGGHVGVRAPVAEVIEAEELNHYFVHSFGQVKLIIIVH